LVDVLELLLNDASTPSLAAAICSALAKCSVPSGEDKRIAELQQNLADSVRENGLAVPSMLENIFTGIVHDDQGSQASKDGNPPLLTCRPGKTLEKESTKDDQYQPLDGSQLSHTSPKVQLDPLGMLTATAPSPVHDIGLDVIIELLNGVWMKPQNDLGQCIMHPLSIF